MRVIKLTPRAAREFQDIIDYYREHSPRGGAKVSRAIYQRLTHIQQSPEVGRKVSGEGVRSLVVPRYRYKLFYRLEDDTIEVLSIFHTSRDPGKAPG